MWVVHNSNPRKNEVPDCVIRAISVALHLSWYQVFDELSALARAECSVTCDDRIWGLYLYRMGCQPFTLPVDCPRCLSVKHFCRMFPEGRYVIGTGSHAVAVINGDYYDSWDSGETIASFFWKVE